MQLWEYYHQHDHRVVWLLWPTKYSYGDTMTNTAGLWRHHDQHEHRVDYHDQHHRVIETPWPTPQWHLNVITNLPSQVWNIMTATAGVTTMTNFTVTWIPPDSREYHEHQHHQCCRVMWYRHCTTRLCQHHGKCTYLHHHQSCMDTIKS